MARERYKRQEKGTFFGEMIYERIASPVTLRPECDSWARSCYGQNVIVL